MAANHFSFQTVTLPLQRIFQAHNINLLFFCHAQWLIWGQTTSHIMLKHRKTQTRSQPTISGHPFRFTTLPHHQQHRPPRPSFGTHKQPRSNALDCRVTSRLSSWQIPSTTLPCSYSQKTMAYKSSRLPLPLPRTNKPLALIPVVRV